MMFPDLGTKGNIFCCVENLLPSNYIYRQRQETQRKRENTEKDSRSGGRVALSSWTVLYVADWSLWICSPCSYKAGVDWKYKNPVAFCRVRKSGPCHLEETQEKKKAKPMLKLKFPTTTLKQWLCLRTLTHAMEWQRGTNAYPGVAARDSLSVALTVRVG